MSSSRIRGTSRIVIVVVAVAGLVACSSKQHRPDRDATRAGAAAARTSSEQPVDEQASAEEEDQTTDIAPTTTTPEQETRAEVVEGIGPVATVEGREISAAKFAREFEVWTSQGLHKASLKKMLANMMRHLVRDARLDVAIAKANVEVTDGEVEEWLEGTASNLDNFEEEPTLEAVAARFRREPSDYLERVRRHVATKKLLLRRGLQEPTPEDLRAFYEERIDEEFSREEHVYVEALIVPVEPGSDDATRERAMAMAAELQQKAGEAGVVFRDLRAASADDSIKVFHRDFRLHRGSGDLAEVAYGLSDGDISTPIRDPRALYVLKRIELVEAGPIPFEDVAEKIDRRLSAKRTGAASKRLRDELREEYDVAIHEENVEEAAERMSKHLSLEKSLLDK